MLIRATALAVLLPCAAVAQSNCMPRDDMAAWLGEQFAEARVSMALADTGQMVETYANLDTGTWTLTATQPGGPTCIVVYGRAFQLVAAEPAGVDG
jgi:hypothetical protein